MYIMKQFNFRSLGGVVLAAVLLTGCASLKKMKKNADKITYDVTPEILESHGGNVDVAIQGRIPESFFVKGATVTATPVFVYEGGEQAFKPYSLQGEKVDGNAKVIPYAKGGSFSYKGSVPFVEGMRKGDLEVRIVASKGAKSVTFDPIKVAEGTIATSTLVENTPASIMGVQKAKNTTGVYDPTIDKFQRVVPDSYRADLMYLINSAYVRGQELRKEDVAKLTKYIKDAYSDEKKELKDVEISAYASPDGALDLNEKLAKNREKSASKYVNRQLKRHKIDTDVTGRFTPEDWEGFKELVEASDIPDKQLILRVLAMYSDPEVRDREIKNISEAFTVLADKVLPKLRRAKITASVDVIGKSDEEILALATSDASKLNQAELLYAATLTSDKNQQMAIYNSFIKNFPSDWRGYNNLGMIQMQNGDVDAASKNFNKADELDPKNPIVMNNLGAVALTNGDVAKAEELFGAANGAGGEVDYNLGVVAIKKGDYDAAVKYFGKCTCVNAALAQMLAGDNNGALRTLNNNKSDDALVDYLKAVIGARTAKTTLLYASLRDAVAADAKYKELAKTDLEFAKYFDDAQFKDIVK